jgi:hypothetical protein
MRKIIRPRYSVELSIGLLLLIFALSFFLSQQVFDIRHLAEGENVYFGTFLVSCAVIIMVLVFWEEFLFPVHVKPETDGAIIFRNHRNKLKTQALIYCLIPLIFGFVYFTYEVNLVRFIIWAAVGIGLPIVGKLVSGIKNYNDFLKLTDTTIQYKNNDLEGTFALTEVRQVILVRDDRKVLHKIQLTLTNGNPVTIDLDEMELEEFLTSIDTYMTTHYANLVK